MNPLLRCILEGVLFLAGSAIMCAGLMLAIMFLSYAVTRLTGREEREE